MSSYIDIAIKLIKDAEGYMPYRYYCPAGKLTQGYGRNLEAHPLTDKEMLRLDSDGSVGEDEATIWLKNEVIGLLEYFSTNEIFKAQSDVRKAVLIDMAYNMGYKGLMNFKKMWKALDNKDYAEASRQMKDSNWYVQVGNRSKRNVNIMASNKL